MPAVPLRVLTYNVRSLRDDRAAVAAVIRSLRPDLALIQEAPRFWRWRRRCARLAVDSGMRVLTGGRPAAGNLLLGGHRVAVLRCHQVRFAKRPRLHQRAVMGAHVAVEGREVLVLGTHLSVDPGERVAQAGAVGDYVRLFADGAAVLGADANDVPGSPTWSALTAALRDAYALAPLGDAPTFPARAPTRRIDAVFVSAGIDVRGCGVPTGLSGAAGASDHLPVVADLELI